MTMTIQTVHLGFALASSVVLFALVASAIVYGCFARVIRQSSMPRWAEWMPSVQKMDRLLWRSLLFGFVLLTAALLSGTYAGMTLNKIPVLLSQGKLCLAYCAWAVLLAVLWLHHFRGWRGFNSSMILGAVCLLVLVVFDMSFRAG